MYELLTFSYQKKKEKMNVRKRVKWSIKVKIYGSFSLYYYFITKKAFQLNECGEEIKRRARENCSIHTHSAIDNWLQRVWEESRNYQSFFSFLWVCETKEGSYLQTLQNAFIYIHKPPSIFVTTNPSLSSHPPCVSPRNIEK